MYIRSSKSSLNGVFLAVSHWWELAEFLLFTWKNKKRMPIRWPWNYRLVLIDLTFHPDFSVHFKLLRSYAPVQEWWQEMICVPEYQGQLMGLGCGAKFLSLRCDSLGTAFLVVTLPCLFWIQDWVTILGRSGVSLLSSPEVETCFN